MAVWPTNYSIKRVLESLLAAENRPNCGAGSSFPSISEIKNDNNTFTAPYQFVTCTVTILPVHFIHSRDITRLE